MRLYCSFNQVDRAMGMDFILNQEGENEGEIENVERKTSDQ
jgi:hypothetical protein